jgi:hypothetical protein
MLSCDEREEIEGEMWINSHCERGEGRRRVERVESELFRSRRG